MKYMYTDNKSFEESIPVSLEVIINQLEHLKEGMEISIKPVK